MVAKKAAKRVVKKAPAKKATKKVAKKVAKKAAPKTQWEYLSKATGKPVSERYYKAHPELVKRKKVQPKAAKKATKTAAKAAPPKKKGLLGKAVDKAKAALAPKSRATKKPPKPVKSNRFEERTMVNGLCSTRSYVVVSRVNPGDDKPFVAMRNMGNTVRVHAFPNFKENGVEKPPYEHGLIRTEKGYQTCWVPRDEAKALMVHLGNQGFRLLNAERLEAFLSATSEHAARSALELH